MDFDSIRSIIESDPALSAYVQHLGQQVQHAEDQLHGSQQRNDDLNQRLQDLSQRQTMSQEIAAAIRSAVTPAPSSPPKLDNNRLSMPESFNGTDPSKCRPFLAQCAVYFDGRGITNDDKFKVSFAITLLRGTPLDLVVPELQKEFTARASWVRRWDEFSKALIDNFGQVDEKHTAEVKLQKLQQTKSASEYWVKFKSLAVLTDWHDEALSFQFRRGLKSSVKDLMINYDKPKTLEELKNLAIRIDNRIFERDQERKGDTRTPYIPSRSSDRFKPSQRDELVFVQPPTAP